MLQPIMLQPIMLHPVVLSTCDTMLKESFENEKPKLMEMDRKMSKMGYITIILSLIGILITFTVNSKIGLIMLTVFWSLFMLTLATKMILATQIETVTFIIENSDCNCANTVVIEDKEE